MAWIAAAIGAGGSIWGGALGASGARSAASAQSRAQQAAIEEQRRQFNVALGLQQPYAVTGTGALGQLARLYGLPYQSYQAPDLSGGTGPSGTALRSRDVAGMIRSGMSVDDIVKLGRFVPSEKYASRSLNVLRGAGLSPDQIALLQSGAPPVAGGPGGITTPTGPDPSVFQQSPGYQFIRDEGQRDLGNSFAARGGAFSGNALRGLSQFNQGLASQDYYNFVNQLNNMAGLGQTAAGQSGNAALQTGANVGNLLAAQGDARASGIANSANIWGNAISGAANAVGGYFGNRNPYRTPPYNPGYYTGGA